MTQPLAAASAMESLLGMGGHDVTFSFAPPLPPERRAWRYDITRRSTHQLDVGFTARDLERVQDHLDGTTYAAPGQSEAPRQQSALCVLNALSAQLDASMSDGQRLIMQRYERGQRITRYEGRGEEPGARLSVKLDGAALGVGLSWEMLRLWGWRAAMRYPGLHITLRDEATGAREECWAPDGAASWAQAMSSGPVLSARCVSERGALHICAAPVARERSRLALWVNHHVEPVTGGPLLAAIRAQLTERPYRRPRAERPCRPLPGLAVLATWHALPSEHIRWGRTLSYLNDPSLIPHAAACLERALPRWRQALAMRS